MNYKEKNSNLHSAGGLELNTNTKECFVDGNLIKLTPIEYKILFLMIKNPGKVFIFLRILG